MFSIASALPHWVYYVFAGILGACVGSLLNVCIVRIPNEESIVWPPSHCRHCSHQISWWENIPVFSFIILRGRCSECHRPISPRYLLVELLTIGFSIAAWWRFHDVRLYLAYFFLLIAPLIVISFIDIALKIIPDVISLPGIVAGFALNVLLAGKGGYGDAAIDSVLGILIGGGFLFVVATAYEKIKKIEGLGGGDVKLAAMLGAFFGWRASIFILMVSSVVGSLFGLILILIMKKNTKYAIPFGPFLAIGGLVYLFFGQRIINWYMSLF